MDTNFNTVIYQLEMQSLVNTAIKKLKAEHPDYEVFTMSLTTDFASGVSACLLYTSPSPRDGATSRMPSSA